VPRTGVIYVMTEAAASYGYKPGEADGEDGWCNLGQGSRRRAPARLARPAARPCRSRGTTRSTRPSRGCGSCARPSPISTTTPIGAACSSTAPRTWRLGGGRTALTRAAAALGQINLGHFLPDYTAYEELLDVFRLFSPIPILLEGDRLRLLVGDLRREILGRGLSARSS
jgi:N-succinyldiaminopimelate aminotransferase